MLFETESVYTYDEYRKSVYSILTESKKHFLFIIGLIFLFFTSIYDILRYNSNHGYIALIFSIVMPVILFCALECGIRKAYYSNKALKDITVHFSFYDDHFEVESKRGKSYIEYKDLYKFYEKKDNFYPMTGSNVVFIIQKSKCSDELISFLHNKALAVK